MQSNSQRRRSRRDDAASSRKLDRARRREAEKYNDSGDAPPDGKWVQEDEKIKMEREEWQLDQESSSHWTVEFEGPYYKYKCVGKGQKEKGEGKDQESGEDHRHKVMYQTSKNKQSDDDEEIFRVDDYDIDYDEDGIQDEDAEEDGDPDSETEEDADGEEDDEDDDDIDDGVLLEECEYAEAEVMTERHDDVSDKSVGDPKDANSNIYFWTYALIVGLFLAFTLYLTFNVLPFEMKVVKEKIVKVKQNEIEK